MLTSTVSSAATGGRFSTIDVTCTAVASPPGSATVTVHPYGPGVTPTLGAITTRPDSIATQLGAPELPVIVRASASVARSVTVSDRLLASEGAEGLRARRGVLIDVDRHTSGCAKPTAVDHRIADRHVPVLADRWRVDAVGITGGRLDVDDRTTRTECGEVDGDRLLVSRVEEAVVGDRCRLRTRTHRDPQHCSAGEFTIAHLVVHHRRARRPRCGSECNRSVQGDRRRTQRRIRVVGDRDSELVAVGVGVVGQHRRCDTAAVDDIGGIVTRSLADD